jgi:hypothetical protein
MTHTEANLSDDQEDWQAWIRWSASPPAAAIGHDTLPFPRRDTEDISTDTQDTLPTLSRNSSATISFEDAPLVSSSSLPRQAALQDSDTISSLHGAVPTLTAQSPNNDRRSLHPTSNRGVERTKHKRRLAPKVNNELHSEGDDKFVHYSPYGGTTKGPRTKRKLDKLETESYLKTREVGACVACMLRRVKVSHARSMARYLTLTCSNSVGQLRSIYVRDVPRRVYRNNSVYARRSRSFQLISLSASLAS